MQIDEGLMSGSTSRAVSVRRRNSATHAGWKLSATMSVGRFLRRRREVLGLSEEMIEELSSSTPWRLTGTAINSIENGERFPELPELLVYFSLLDVNPSSLLELARIASRRQRGSAAEPGEKTLTRANLAASARNFTEAQATYRYILEETGADRRDSAEMPPRFRAFIHLRLSAALAGCGASESAAEAAGTALRLARDFPDIASDARTRLSALHLTRRETGEAREKAEEAVRLARKVGGVTLAGALLARGRALFQMGLSEEAMSSFHSARKSFRESRERRGKTETTGEIGLCLGRLNRRRDARRWVDRTVKMARHYRFPDLEGNWLVELGRLAYEDGDLKEAGCHAMNGMRLGRGKGQALLAFRAGWLRYIISRAGNTGKGDRRILELLCKLYPHLESHRHVREPREFRKAILPCLFPETPGHA